MKRKITSSLIVILITIVLAAGSQGAVLTGAIEGAQESVEYSWGDGINNMYQNWSVSNENSSGWFYGSSKSGSNVDVCVVSGLSDPTTVTDASVFTYYDSSSRNIPDIWGGFRSAAWAQEGDTVFFKSPEGYYGAWYIEDIYPHPITPIPGRATGTSNSALNGTWYFIDDGTSDFSIPEPCTLLLLGMGGMLMRKRKLL
ncbi:MAG: PEP-CTERM sorting domain-containing protein [Planctomycetota bacterium]|jgi:hypothetical protein